jgi:hypothetical protein
VLQVDVYKPVSSKVNNSEAYIIGRGFRKPPDGVRDALLRFVSKDVYASHAMLPRSVMPASFLSSAKGCGQFFAERTRAAIEDTLSKKEMHPGQLKAVRDIQDLLAAQWVQKFRVNKLEAKLRLSPVRHAPHRQHTQRKHYLRNYCLGKAPSPVWVALHPIGSRHIHSVLLSAFALLSTC